MKSTKNKYKDPTRKDWIIGIARLLIYLSVIGFGALILIPKYWYWWFLIFSVSTMILIITQNRNYACRCRECENEFALSFMFNLIAPHGVDRQGSWQMVKCPQCGKRGRATVIKVVKAV